jgi:inner membrane protein
MYEYSWAWLVIALLFVLFEMGHPGLFFFLSFAIGACIMSIVALADFSLEFQSILFLGITMVALYGLKRWLKVSFTSKKSTNTEALLGRHVVVISDINPERPGAVSFDGSVWTAHTHQEIFLKGDFVVIHGVRGAHVVVGPISKKIV